MTRGTVVRQQALGALRLAPQVGLAAKLAALESFTTNLSEASAA